MWELLLSYPEAAFVSGILVFTNVVEPLWWYLGAAGAVAAVAGAAAAGRRTQGWRWWQKAVVGTLQGLVVLGVILLLAGPGLRTTTMEPGANTVAVLTDLSGSMAFPDTTAAGGPSRIEAARALAGEELLPLLEGMAEVALFGFDTSAIRLEGVDRLVSGNADTHLTAAMGTVLSSFRGAPLAAVILLSDGADNDQRGAPDLTAIAAHGVPVHTIAFGPTALPGEVQLADVELAATAPSESRVTARVVLEHASEGQAVLKVRDAGTLIAARRIALPADERTVRTEISFSAGEPGLRELTFELEPPPGDRLSGNNAQERLLTVAEHRRRVLYLEGEPRWEYKFLRRALDGDDVLTLTSWLATTDRKTYRQGVEGPEELADGFPADRLALYGYDVVVLGSVAATTLSAAQHADLEAFVSERGGSLLALAGREALDDGRWDVTPLAAALPVLLARQSAPTYVSLNGRARPTILGATSPFTQLLETEGGNGWSTLPELGDLQHLGAAKPAASTLLEMVAGESVHPLLVVQPYGLGTTAVLATASTWRWQMRTPPEDPRHGLFWRQLLRQLAEAAQRQRSVALTPVGEGIGIRARLLDEAFRPLADATARALVTRPDRSTAELDLAAAAEPGVLAAHFTPDAAGVHRVDVTLATPEGDPQTVTRFVHAGGGVREQFQPVRNESLLRRISDATGGRFLEPGGTAELAQLLRFRGSGIRTVEVLPLWQAPLFFLFLVLLKILEWALRRWWGRI